MRQGGKGKDIFALVKLYMSDCSLSQDPLLVFPESCLNDTENFINEINTTRSTIQQQLDSDRVAELRELANALKEDFPHMTRTIEYYEDLCNPMRPRVPYPHLGFIENGANSAYRLGQVELGERAPPPKPRHLQVVFHRG